MIWPRGHGPRGLNIPAFRPAPLRFPLHPVTPKGGGEEGSVSRGPGESTVNVNSMPCSLAGTTNIKILKHYVTPSQKATRTPPLKWGRVTMYFGKDLPLKVPISSRHVGLWRRADEPTTSYDHIDVGILVVAYVVVLTGIQYSQYSSSNIEIWKLRN